MMNPYLQTLPSLCQFQVFRTPFSLVNLRLRSFWSAATGQFQYKLEDFAQQSTASLRLSNTTDSDNSNFELSC